MRLGHIDPDSRVCSGLAGLEAGILAGLCLLLWQAISSLMTGEVAWQTSVALVTAVFGQAVRRDGMVTSVTAGLALQLSGGGIAGILFGLVLRTRWAARRVVLTGLVLGIGWYYLAYEIVLRTIVARRYPPSLRLPLIASHLAFGLALSVYPRFWRALRQDLWSGN